MTRCDWLLHNPAGQFLERKSCYDEDCQFGNRARKWYTLWYYASLHRVRLLLKNTVGGDDECDTLFQGTLY